MKAVLVFLLGVLVVAGCGAPAAAPSQSVPSPAASASPTNVPTAASTATVTGPTATPNPATGKAVSVLYAGSLVNLMEKGIGPAFQQSGGITYQGQGAGSVALANAIRDRTKTADVFVSADPAVNRTLMGAANGDWVSWYVVFARTSLVIGYSPKSTFAPDFEKAKAGSLSWYQVLQEPGLKLGRTDPNLDPKGYRTFFLFDLAQTNYHVPDLRQKVLGADTNAAQIFPEETLETRLETGALDAGIFYLNEAVEKNLPYLTLPDEINLSNPELVATYATVSYTNAKGQTFKGGPIVYTAAVLNRAKDAAAGEAFVAYLLSSNAQGIMKEHGLLAAPALYGGDKASIPAALQPTITTEYKG